MAPRSFSHVDAVDRRGEAWRIAQRALLIAYVVVLAVLVIYAIATGPQWRAARDLEMAQQMAEENRAVCQQLGKEPGSAGFAECASRLDAIRARHKNRLLRDLSPIL